MDGSILPKYEVWMNVVPVGSGLRQNIKHEYKVWTNIVPKDYVRKSFFPKYEVWMNIVPVGKRTSSEKKPLSER